MTEPGGRLERRPAEIPADWLTRQQAQVELKLRSAYGLKRLIDLLQPTPDHFKIVGQAGYLSPDLIQQMRLELSAVEDIRDLPGYLSAMAAQAEIGCNPTKFLALVNEFPPSVHEREVVKARNNNSEVNPAYAQSYIDSLKLHYEPQLKLGRGSNRSEESTARSHPSAALKNEVLARIDSAPEVHLVDPARTERDQLLVKVSRAIDQLDHIPARSSDLRLTQLWQQLNQAADDLRGNRPMPQGVERLLSQVSRYVRPDDD